VGIDFSKNMIQLLNGNLYIKSLSDEIQNTQRHNILIPLVSDARFVALYWYCKTNQNSENNSQCKCDHKTSNKTHWMCDSSVW
jgi:hypothetical protein